MNPIALLVGEHRALVMLILICLKSGELCSRVAFGLASHNSEPMITGERSLCLGRSENAQSAEQSEGLQAFIEISKIR